MVEGEPLSVKVMADQINAQKYHAVHVFDPHSDVTGALVNNINIISNEKFVTKVFDDHLHYRSNNNDFCLVAPDAGALKKATGLAKLLGIPNDNFIRASKIRDVKNGELSECNFVGNVSGKTCVIVDDIIDGGATFVQLANMLRWKKASKVHLIASHGIFSKGIGLQFLDKIFITDSINCINNDSIVTIPITSFHDL